MEDEEFQDVAVDGGEEGEGGAEVGAAGWGVGFGDCWWVLVQVQERDEDKGG